MFQQKEITIKQIEIMKTKEEYAKIIFNGGKTYMVVDSSNQCLFATTSEIKAKNRLKSILKSAGLI